MFERKTLGVTLGLIVVGIFIGTVVTAASIRYLDLYGQVGFGPQGSHRRVEIHTQITVRQGANLILDEYHSGVVTNLGDNLTLAKLFGDADYLIADYLDNCTYISIGNQGSLSESSTQLPGEWNRTAGTIEDEANSQLNLTCTIYPDNGGPYTADCIGLNWETSGDGNLWGYDTFTEVTGIDETFTINIEIQVSVSYS